MTAREWINAHKLWTIFLVVFGMPLVLGIVVTIVSPESSYTSQPYSAQKEQEMNRIASNTLQIMQSIKVTSMRVYNDSIGTSNLSLTIKNTSKKTIDAAEVSAELYDNFDEPAVRYTDPTSNRVTAIFQETIPPGQSTTGNFNLAVYTHATKAKNSSIMRVHFTDGTTLDGTFLK